MYPIWKLLYVYISVSLLLNSLLITGCRFVGLPNYVDQDSGNHLMLESGISVDECTELCEKTNDCNSFQYCGGAKCHLKDKKLFQKLITSTQCTTYYRKCDQGNYS